MNKHDVARILEEIAVLLTLKGENPFKVRAYHNAARVIENLDVDLEKVVAEEHLQLLPGIGAHISEKVATLVRKGRLPYYEQLKKSVPRGLLNILDIPGLGGKKVKVLYEKLKILNVEELAKACEKGRVARLKGFGLKTQNNILQALDKLKTYGKRSLWWNAEKIALPILSKLLKAPGIKKVEIAGSFRRKLETVGDLDFVASSRTPSKVTEWFTKQPWVEKVLSVGPTKASVQLTEGMQVDLRVVAEKEFGSALLYLTGSKDHNIALRQRAIKKGYSLSEYGLKPAPKKRLTTEADIYKVLGLAYIPPELRENMGEIEAAARDKLPTLIETEEIKGVFHCHTTASDGHNTLDEMVSAAQKMKWQYIGISDHSKSSFQANGLDEERLLEQIKQIKRLNSSKKFLTHVFAGLECDILTNGKLDFPDEILKQLDFVIGSVHRSFKQDEKTMTKRLIRAIESPYLAILGHVTGRLLLKREPYAFNLPKIIDACIANKKVIELNAQPMRLDMDWRLWHLAAEKGLKCIINPDAHSAADLQYVRAGVNIARKGWLEKGDVINTLPLAKIGPYLRS